MNLLVTLFVLLACASIAAFSIMLAPKSIDLGVITTTDDLTTLYAEGHYTPAATAPKATGGGASDATITPSQALWTRIGRTVSLRVKVAVATAGATDLLSFALSIPSGVISRAAGVAVAVSATQTAASGAGVTSLDAVVIPNGVVDLTTGGATMTVTFPSAVPNDETADLEVCVTYLIVERSAG